MQTENDTSKPEESPQQEAGEGCSGATCSVSLVVGRVYRAKKPKGCSFPPLCDDRQIKWIGGDQVQYDSPSVQNGRRYPTISRDKFLAWVDRDVTDELPDGEWADYPPNAPAMARADQPQDTESK